MLLVNAAKTLCDFLLLFSFATLFNAYGRPWPVMGAVLALAFVSSLVLQRSGGKKAARVVCGLLPALGLFAARSVTETVITAVIIAFYFVLTLTGKNEIHYEDYKYWFGFPAVPVAVVFTTCLVKWPIRPASVVCAGLYLLLGVLVLRRKRIGAGAGIRIRAVNAAELVGTLLFAALVSIGLYLIMSRSAKILEIITLPFGFLLQALAWLADWLRGLLGTVQPEETPMPTQTESELPEEMTEIESVLPEAGRTASLDWVGTLFRVVLGLLALAVVVYLVYRFYKMLRRIRREDGADDTAVEEGRDQTFFSRRNGRKRKKKASGPSNNERIRRLYKDFLLFARTCGVEITRQTTSADVLEASDRMIAREEAKRLREIYIRARYNDAEEVSDAEVEEAKSLLETIRERQLTETIRS